MGTNGYPVTGSILRALQTTQTIKFGQYGSHCLDANLETRELFVSPCRQGTATQRWGWSFANTDRLHKYERLDPLPH